MPSAAGRPTCNRPVRLAVHLPGTGTDSFEKAGAMALQASSATRKRAALLFMVRARVGSAEGGAEN